MKAPHSSAGDGMSPLITLRADLAGRQPTREDDDAVIIAALLRHAALRPRSSQSKRSLSVARGIARTMVTSEDLRFGPGFDEPGGRMPFKSLRVVADRAMRIHGNVLLASRILDSLAALIPLESPEGGRLLAQRAAAAFYLSDNELAFERYRRVLTLGRKMGDAELVARGTHGMAASRMTAGNIPEAERMMRRAIALAGKKYPRVASQSTLKLAIIQATRGDFDGSVVSAWRAYQLARNCEADRRVVMANLANLLLEAGHPEAALSASVHLLRLSLHHGQRLAVLGTYARAAGELGDRAAVEFCVEKILEAAKPPAYAQSVADALLECSHALDDIGQRAQGTRLRARAQELATRHGYHDIAYLAEYGMRRGKARVHHQPSKATQAIASEVRALEPDDLPLTVHAG